MITFRRMIGTITVISIYVKDIYYAYEQHNNTSVLLYNVYPIETILKERKNWKDEVSRMTKSLGDLYN